MGDGGVPAGASADGCCPLPRAIRPPPAFDGRGVTDADHLRKLPRRAETERRPPDPAPGGAIRSLSPRKPARLCRRPPAEGSEERRVGKEWARTGRHRWSPYHSKK